MGRMRALMQVSFVTKAHFEEAMAHARRSVPESAIQQYESYVQSMKQSTGEARNFKFDDVLEESGSDGDGEEASEDLYD